MSKRKSRRGGVNRNPLTEAQKSLFVAGTKFSGVVQSWNSYLQKIEPHATGRVAKEFRGMSLGNKGYADRRSLALPSWYEGPNRHKVKGRSSYYTKKSWETKFFAKGETVELRNLQEIALQLSIASHMSEVQMAHWKFVLAERARKIFQDSFVLKRFNSDGAVKWRYNTRSTYTKRRKKGTWPGAGGLMMETGALQKSIKVKKIHSNDYVVTTTPAANGRIYAGVHNNPTAGMTYGHIFGAQPVTQRQFMGHSTKIFEFMEAYESKYLFDMVFRVPYRGK